LDLIRYRQSLNGNYVTTSWNQGDAYGLEVGPWDSLDGDKQKSIRWRVNRVNYNIVMGSSKSTDEAWTMMSVHWSGGYDEKH